MKTFFNRNIREIGLLGLIIILGIFVNIRSQGSFFTSQNINDILSQTAILIILSMGMMMVIVTSGIDLSVGSIMALSAMVSVLILRDNLTLSPIIVVIISIAVGLICGFINGILISRLSILPIIATLGMMNVYRGFTYIVSKGSWVLQQDMSKEFMYLGQGSIFGLNFLIIIAIIVSLCSYYFLEYVGTGRKIFAIGNSEESAKVSGISTKNITLLVYSIMGALAGLGGILYVCKYAAAQGATALGYEMDVIASCVLGGVSVSGGVGKVQGVLLGAILFGLLSNALPLLQISPFWQNAIKGLIILLSIMANAYVTRRVVKKALERRVI